MEPVAKEGRQLREFALGAFCCSRRSWPIAVHAVEIDSVVSAGGGEAIISIDTQEGSRVRVP
jgi:hypothetical protein